MKTIITTIRRRFRKLLDGQYPLSYIIYELLLDKQNTQTNKLALYLYFLFLRSSYKKIGEYEEVIFKTYDGMGQSTHPSIVHFGNNKVIAITPFPYGNDKFENPSIYYSENGSERYYSIDKQPVVYPKAHDKLIYLSDPDLHVKNDNLVMIYRECEYANENKYFANIYETRTNDLVNWTTPVLLFSSKDGAMSPHCINIQDQEYLYYVLFENASTKLFRRDSKGVEQSICVNNMPSGYMLWHIDMFYYKYNLYGLFTLSTDHYGSDSVLFLAHTIDLGKTWDIKDKIVVDKKHNLVTKTYKATVLNVDDSLDIYISIRRKDRYWGIYRKSHFEEEIKDIMGDSYEEKSNVGLWHKA